ncbi:MAG: glycosyltransferase family 4 protein [Kiritimatiellota bacterium]|nr:glycosyltransferase family 4 protein [Kiritimatiellota bacterium]
MKNGVCILPHLSGLGGPVSFQSRLVSGLQARGIQICQDPLDPVCAAVLVIGGTRHAAALWRARQRGVRIVQRLNGMNWIHRRQRTGLKHFIRSEMNNALLANIRRHLADRIVYQSQFARNWWQTVHGAVPSTARVIYNGVDLHEFNPAGPQPRPDDPIRLLLVEGHLRGGYEQGLVSAVQLTRLLNQQGRIKVELMVAGDVPESLRQQVQGPSESWINWTGIVPQEQIPQLDRSAHILFSADLNAACPNAVIEALACGLPVIAFATGSLPELVEGDAGMVVPYGSNYWKLEPPDIRGLAGAFSQVLAGGEKYRQGARARAEAAFGLDRMVEQYLSVLLNE